jgi:phosphoglycerate dehydrogenase-like enzyme
MSSYHAILLGAPTCLPWAYPHSLRKEIAHRVSLFDPVLTAENWRLADPGLRQAEIILSTWGMPQLDEEFLDHFPNLQAVFYAAGAVKCFATEAAYNRGILICSAFAANAIPVAEYTTATTLLSLKKFWHFARRTNRSRSWKREVADVTGNYHPIVGLISLGAVGRTAAQMLSRYDIDLVAYDPYVSPTQAAEIGVTLLSLEELFARADVISAHTPLLPETHQLIDGRLFRKMKPGATFINTSRGAVVKEADLIEVLRQRNDLTAVLDVTWPEPPAVDSPLYEMDNVVLTPHIAGSLGNEVTRMGRWMVDEMYRFLDDRPLQHQVVMEQLAHMA